MSFEERFSFLDVAVGMEYCGDMEEIYVEVLEEYADTDFAGMLETAFSAEDWADYRIQAHALKSTSRTIGAMELGDIGEQLEFAARDGEIDKIKSLHGIALAAVAELIAKIRAAL